ncbi:MAG TPA: hypothetical protein PKW07_07545 [Syntrophorhabdaceae bacterium]|nr:hypothetical protein [Syntrophorhabdaceae bacterium]
MKRIIKTPNAPEAICPYSQEDVLNAGEMLFYSGHFEAIAWR